MQRSSWIVLFVAAAVAAAVPLTTAQTLEDVSVPRNGDSSDLRDAITPPVDRTKDPKDVDAQLTKLGVTKGPSAADKMVPAADIQVAMRQLLTPIAEAELPWTGPMTGVLRKHLTGNMRAAKRRMRRTSVPVDGQQAAAATGDVTAAAAADTYAAAAAALPASSKDASTCRISNAPGELVGGWASNSTDSYGTATMIYSRIQLAYQDNKASEDVIKFPDTTLTAAARRQTSNTNDPVPTTYVIISVSRGWSAVNSKCNNPSGCKTWGSTLYADPDIWRKDECKQAHCWEVAECLSSSGVCFMRVTVLDWDPVLGYTSEGSHTLRIMRDGAAPAVNGNVQRAAFAMCSPCKEQQCT